jgi:hypothetical protein
VVVGGGLVVVVVGGGLVVVVVGAGAPVGACVVVVVPGVPLEDELGVKLLEFGKVNVECAGFEPAEVSFGLVEVVEVVEVVADRCSASDETAGVEVTFTGTVVVCSATAVPTAPW